MTLMKPRVPAMVVPRMVMGAGRGPRTANSASARRTLASAAEAAEAAQAAQAAPPRWSLATRLLHGVLAVSIVGGVGTVLQAQEQPKTPEGDKKRGDLMFWHKSFGVATITVLPLRYLARVFERAPTPLPSPSWMRLASVATHWGLHGFMISMSVTGYVMAEYSGRPLPFFFTTIPAEQLGSDPALAKQAYGYHKTIGKYGKVLIPLHVAGAGTHMVMGQRILYRMNPFVF